MVSYLFIRLGHLFPPETNTNVFWFVQFTLSPSYRSRIKSLFIQTGIIGKKCRLAQDNVNGVKLDISWFYWSVCQANSCPCIFVVLSSV